MFVIKKSNIIKSVFAALCLVIGLFLVNANDNVKAATTESISAYNAKGTVIAPANIIDVPNGSSYNILKLYDRGMTVEIVGKSTSFYKIKYNGSYAYVLISRIQEVTPSSNGNSAASKTEVVKSYSATGTVIAPANVIDVPNGSSYNILKLYDRGMTVEIVGKSTSFYKIKYNGSYAYVLISRIQEVIPVSTKTETVKSYAATGTVVSPANVIDVPNSLSYKIFKTYARGTSVKIVGKSKSFYKIKYNNTFAYVLIDRVQEVKPYTGIVKTNANIKSYALPSSNSKVMSTIKKSNILYVTATVGKWYQVKNGNSVEFIPNTNVKISATETEKAISLNKLGVITSKANIVNDPNTLAKVKTTYAKGKAIVVVGQTKSFYKIRYGNTYAYVLISKVKLNK